MPENYSEAPSGIKNNDTQSLTPELVRQVTDKVCKLLMQDLKQANERRRIRNPRFRR